MTRSIGLTAWLLVLAGCAGGAGNPVDVQVVNGIGNDIDRHLTIKVKMISTDLEFRAPFPHGLMGDVSTFAHLELPYMSDGNELEFRLVDAADNTIVKGSCLVAGAGDTGWARAHVAVVPLVSGTNVDCVAGLVPK